MESSGARRMDGTTASMIPQGFLAGRTSFPPESSHMIFGLVARIINALADSGRTPTMRCGYCLMAVTLILASYARAGEFNQKVSVGDACPAFTNLPATDDKSYSLADFKDKELLLVVITCNHCPVALDYEDRIIAFARKHAGKVGVVAICVSKEAEDSMAEMKKRAKDKSYPYPYLRDET